MRTLLLILTGALSVIVIGGVGGLIFLQSGATGFSARADPSAVEIFAAQTARKLALPADARDRRNPIGNSKEVLEDAMAHWADHCAVCHGNDGSGEAGMGQQMYPHAPDMRRKSTQQRTEGELFYIIENGIRLTGMPAWGGTAAGAKDSWKLVHFIRHLPDLSAGEIARMDTMNPKSPDDIEHEQEADRFLNEQALAETPKQQHNQEKRQ